jgi:hypothetical protein
LERTGTRCFETDRATKQQRNHGADATKSQRVRGAEGIGMTGRRAEGPRDLKEGTTQGSDQNCVPPAKPSASFEEIEQGQGDDTGDQRCDRKRDERERAET